MKKIIISFLMLIILTGCGRVNDSLLQKKRDLKVKRDCCTDSGGVWNGKGCQPAANDRNGNYSEEFYNECIEYSNND